MLRWKPGPYPDIEVMNGDDLMSPVTLKTFPRYSFALLVRPCVMSVALVSLLGWGAVAAANAQTPNMPSHAGSQPVFRLDGGNTTYAFGVNERGELQQIYWGGRLGEHDVIDSARSEDDLAGFDSSYNNTPQEYASWGSGLFLEPALKVTFADSNRDLVLHYASSSRHNDNSIDVVLKDISRAVIVTLHYNIDPESGIVARSATIENHEPKPIMIDQAAAAAFSLPAGHYTLSYLSGRWAGEWTLNEEAIHQGQRVLESRRGSTGVQLNPWFAIGQGNAGEEDGETWFGALAWSGSWRITVEQDALDKVRVTGGFNPFDFGYPLKPGEKLESPVFYAGYTDHGMGGASRLLNRFTLTHILPQAPSPKLRPVIYNSWEATQWNVSEAVEGALAEKAAALGISAFWEGADQKAYFELYDLTAKTFKSIDPALRVGGPSTAGGEWIPEFLAHVKQSGAAVDFVTTHTYGVQGGFLDENGKSDTKLDPSPDAIIGDVRRVREQISASAFPGLPLYFTEWSTSYTPRDSIHDSYISAPYILTKLKASQGLLQGMSYWTYTDLFEEPGPPTAPFQGGFGLLNPQGIRKPAFFAYKYLHALHGDSLATNDSQAMLSTKDGDFTGVVWDFEQPEQKVSNRSFYTKVIPSHAAAPIQLRITHLVPNADYRLEVHRTGFHSNDAYSAYIEMGSPKDLSAEQIAHLNELTRDLPEISKTMQSGSTGTIQVSVPMNSNDIVLIELERGRAIK